MKRLTLFILFILPLSLMAQNPLQAHKWQDRVIILFAPYPEQDDLQAQLDRFEEEAQGMRDRKLVVYRLFPDKGFDPEGMSLDSRTVGQLRERFSLSAEGFTMLLLGLDGGEKLRRNDPVATRDLFNLIDSMPMRQAEMRRRQNEGG